MPSKTKTPPRPTIDVPVYDPQTSKIYLPESHK